jgi:hypothetical protein
MNDYVVQYSTTKGVVHEWTYAASHLDAAANMVLTNGCKDMLANDADDSYQSIIVVRKGDYIVGRYTMREVVSRADCMVGLSDKQWLPFADTDDWQS